MAELVKAVDSSPTGETRTRSNRVVTKNVFFCSFSSIFHLLFSQGVGFHDLDSRDGVFLGCGDMSSHFTLGS
jgi:hypothetical protein